MNRATPQITMLTLLSDDTASPEHAGKDAGDMSREIHESGAPSGNREE